MSGSRRQQAAASYRRAAGDDPAVVILKLQCKQERLTAALSDAWSVVLALREELAAERAKAARTS